MDSCYTLHALFTHNPHCHTHTNTQPNTYGYMPVQRHTYTHTQQKQVPKGLEKKKICERELREAASLNFLCKSPSHTVLSRRCVSTSVISVNTKCLSSVGEYVSLLCLPTSKLPHTPSLSTCLMVTTAKLHVHTYSDYKISLILTRLHIQTRLAFSCWKYL